MSETLSPEAWTGPFRAPRNMAAESKGSIHDDATAQKLGFRGGTVAGSIHMDQFVPRLLDLYGDAWFRTGGLSLYFTQATVDSEEVRCTVQAGPDRARLAMQNRDGAQICVGSASGAPDAGAELAGRMADQTPAGPGALRILADLAVGDEAHDLPIGLPREHLDRALEVITEAVPAYDQGVLPPSQAIHLTHQVRRAVLARATQPHVGLFGALEVQHLAGPLRADIEYRARTKVLKLSESPKTENAWYEVVLAEGGRDVARVLYYLRFLKGSSPLWA
jgi:hypothetical protein